jgi:hypothetical protein
VAQVKAPPLKIQQAVAWMERKTSKGKREIIREGEELGAMLPVANVMARQRGRGSGGGGGGGRRLGAAVVLLVALLAFCLARADAAASRGTYSGLPILSLLGCIHQLIVHSGACYRGRLHTDLSRST